jgi:CDGSH iron-sulfur domain-containing protein 3
MTVVRLRLNGPIVIEGDDVAVVDWDGRAYPIARRPVALCRCGASGSKPFCDGTHRVCGFTGDQAAPPGPAARTPPDSSSGSG